MIDDLDRTIETLLKEELPIKNGEVDVKFDQPTREWGARLTRPTLNFFLYDVRENATLRQHHWQQVADGNGRSHQAQQKRTPFRIDCNYLLTTWATEPDDEHRLLARTLLALFRHPTLPETVLQGALQNQPFEVPAAVARQDKLTNPAEVWSALDNEMRPSISYVITLALDPWQPIAGPIVRTLTLHSLVRQEPERGEKVVHIGGTVHKDGDPQPDIAVALKGTGFVDNSKADGTFVLGGVPPGEYTLVAWPPEGQPKEKPVSVPGEDYDVDL